MEKHVNKTICTLALALLAVGCGQSDEPAAEQPEPAVEQAAAPSERQVRRSTQREATAELPRREEQDPGKNIPRFEGEAEQDGYGLTMVVDGSTPQAFQESLELIAMDTTSDQYSQLDSALRFLGTYDQTSWAGLDNLYESLDGMTGEEIIERARQLRDERRRR